MGYVSYVLRTSLVWGRVPRGFQLAKVIMGAVQMLSCFKSFLLNIGSLYKEENPRILNGTSQTFQSRDGK